MKRLLIASGIAFLVTIVLMSVIPWTFRSVTTKNCQPDPMMNGIEMCEVVNNGWSKLEVVCSLLGMFAVPFVLGSFGGWQYTIKRQWSFRRTLGLTTLSVFAYLVLMNIFEVVTLQPWDRAPYNHYWHDTVYGPFWFAFFLLGMFGFIAPILFSPRLWSNFRPLGFLKSHQTPKQ